MMTEAHGTRATFESLGLGSEVIGVLEGLGYEEPTPIQARAIPLLLNGQDVLGSAATGTGKTAAFALPLIARLDPSRRAVQGLILAPTRELAVQVAEAVHRYGRGTVTVLALYGGQPIQRQLSSLKRGVQVIVGTPGRLLDHIRRGSLDLSAVRYVVLDEADEMLDMGFIEDIEAILEETPAERQTALFSATFPSRINDLVKRHLRNPERVTIQAEVRKTPRVRQLAYIVPRPHKLETLGRILDLESPTSAIIFCRTRTEVDELTEAMASHGYSPEALHGGFAQTQRDRVMTRFREGVTDLLIATDVAARGLDIQHVSHVINYDIPESPDVYVHRIGRTGRAGREGTAITLVQPREHRLLKAIEHVVKQRIEPARIPTVADLRANRTERIRAALRETLVENAFDAYRPAVQSLAAEFDALDIAAAAAKLAAEATLGEQPADDVDIPHFDVRAEASSSRRRPSQPSRPQAQRGRDDKRTPKQNKNTEWQGSAKHQRSPWQNESMQRDGQRPPKRRADVMTRLIVKVGDQRNVRPKDLVGAITKESNVTGGAIGAIQIGDQSCVVEVPEAVADKVMRALSRTTIKGQRVSVRRERDR